MKVELSPLKLIGFQPLNARLKIKLLEGGKIDLSRSSEYNIDLDYSFREHKSEDSFRCFAKISINETEQPLPGYCLFAEGVGIYELINENLSEADFHNLIMVSSLTSTVNCLRSYLAQLTGSGMAPRYVLPLLDVNNLLRGFDPEPPVPELRPAVPTGKKKSKK